MATKWTHEMFVNFVNNETEDFEVVGEYKNNNTKIEIKHKNCGRTFLIKPADFKRRKRCSPCNINRKKTTSEFQEQINFLANSEYELLGEYINDRTKILTKHKLCSHEWGMTPSHFIQGRRCPKCAGNLKKNTNIFIDEVKKIVNDEYKVCSEYKNSHYKIKFKHQSMHCENYEFYMTPTDFLSGKRCPRCKVLNQSGEKHWKYNPLLTVDERKRRDMFNGQLRKWRNNIFQRDLYTCKKCGIVGSDLNAHHIKSWDSFVDGRFELNNGVTLCTECHRNFHSQYGYGNNDDIQFNKFLASS